MRYRCESTQKQALPVAGEPGLARKSFRVTVSLGAVRLTSPTWDLRITSAPGCKCSGTFFPSDAQCAVHGPETSGAPPWFIQVQRVPAHPVHLDRPLATGQTKDTKYYARIWPRLPDRGPDQKSTGQISTNLKCNNANLKCKLQGHDAFRCTLLITCE